MGAGDERLADRRRRPADVLSLSRQPPAVFPIFIFVAIDILVWAFSPRYLNSVSHADFNFVPALLGAIAPGIF
jgi:hypothetical protein